VVFTCGKALFTRQSHGNVAPPPPHVPLLPDLGERGRGERAALKKDVDMALVHKVRKPDTHGGGFLRYNELSYTIGTIRICRLRKRYKIQGVYTNGKT
jgi:hypothetical protein